MERKEEKTGEALRRSDANLKNEHLSSTYCVPGFLYEVSYLILKATLQDKYFYFYYSGQGN